MTLGEFYDKLRLLSYVHGWDTEIYHEVWTTNDEDWVEPRVEYDERSNILVIK